MLLFYFAAASPSRCLNVTDYFTAVRGLGRGEQRGKRKIWPALPELLASPDAPAAAQKAETLEGTGGKFTFLGSRSHAQVVNPPTEVCKHPRILLVLPSL